MEKLLLGSGLLAILLSCCGTGGNGLDYGSDHCGVDMQCFASYAQNGCSYAKVYVPDDLPYEATITGMYGSDSCSVSLRGLTKDEMLHLAMLDGASYDEAVEYVNLMYSYEYGGQVLAGMSGLTANCVFPQYQMQNLHLSEEWCSGPLVDYVLYET